MRRGNTWWRRLLRTRSCLRLRRWRAERTVCRWNWTLRSRCFEARVANVTHGCCQSLRGCSPHWLPKVSPPLRLKGPTLAWQAYGDLAARGSFDLDLLIEPHRAALVRARLQADGYKPTHDLRGAAATLQASLAGQEEFSHATGEWCLEPHTQFAHRNLSLNLPVAEVFRRARDVEVDGVSVRGMHVHDTLIHLCLHGAKGYWRHLKWLLDLRAFVTANGHRLASRSCAVLPSRTARCGDVCAGVAATRLSRVADAAGIRAHRKATPAAGQVAGGRWFARARCLHGPRASGILALRFGNVGATGRGLLCRRSSRRPKSCLRQTCFHHHWSGFITRFKCCVIPVAGRGEPVSG